jgi:hypothetical protein
MKGEVKSSCLRHTDVTNRTQDFDLRVELRLQANERPMPQLVSSNMLKGAQLNTAMCGANFPTPSIMSERFAKCATVLTDTCV